MNNFNNDLSLCITCYDKDYHLLNKTLSAFQRSTEAPNEIIIISSGIKTENLDIYTHIKINNSNVPIFNINSEKRHNQATARNKGAKASSCKFIMFFDVDDIPHPQKIEITKKAVLQNDLDAVIHDYSFFENFKTITEFEIFRKIHKDQSCTNLYIQDEPNVKIHHSHILCKTEIFKNLLYDESEKFYRKEDGKFCQDLISNNFKIGFVNKELVFYTN